MQVSQTELRSTEPTNAELLEALERLERKMDEGIARAKKGNSLLGMLVGKTMTPKKNVGVG